MNDNLTTIKILRDVSDIMEGIEYDNINKIKEGIKSLKNHTEQLEVIVNYFELTNMYFNTPIC